MRRPQSLLLLLGLLLAGLPEPRAPGRPYQRAARWSSRRSKTGGSLPPPPARPRSTVSTGRWTAALAEAKRRGGARAIAAEAPLLDPQAALPRAAPAPGPYRCRLLRVAAPARAPAAFAPRAAGFCFVGVAGDQLSFTSEIAGHRLGGLPLRDPDDHAADLPRRASAGAAKRRSAMATSGAGPGGTIRAGGRISLPPDPPRAPRTANCSSTNSSLLRGAEDRGRARPWPCDDEDQALPVSRRRWRVRCGCRGRASCRCGRGTPSPSPSFMSSWPRDVAVAHPSGDQLGNGPSLA
jgi:hypothetical protein